MQLSLSKLPWYGQVGAFLAISLGLAGAFYYFYVSPAQVEMAARQATLNALRADINKGLTTARKLAEFQGQIKELEARLESLKPVLPEQKDVGDLLRRIQTLATQSNLTIRTFKPEPTATKQLHAEWPIALELDGTYHNLGLFFDKISKFSRIINISEVEIEAKETPTQASTIVAQCKATTFVLLETPTPGAKATTGQAVPR